MKLFLKLTVRITDRVLLTEYNFILTLIVVNFFQILAYLMVKPTYISECWWYHYPTPYGTYKIKYHFIFMVGQFGPQMVHRAFYTFIKVVLPLLFFPFFGPVVVLG